MFETNIFGYNKIWGITKYLGSSFPECPPVAKGLGNRILPQFSKTTCLGIRHNNHLQAFRPPPRKFHLVAFLHASLTYSASHNRSLEPSNHHSGLRRRRHATKLALNTVFPFHSSISRLSILVALFHQTLVVKYLSRATHLRRTRSTSCELSKNI